MLTGRLIFVTAAIAGCAISRVPPTGAPAGVDAEVRAALFEYLLSERQPPGERVVCVSMQGVEQQDALVLARAVHPAHTYLPAAECGLVPPGTGTMRHLPTGREAVLYQVAAPEWVSGQRSRVRAAWGAASLHGESCSYRVELIGGRWRVTAAEECITS